jgi:hypothetical protein
VPADRTRDGETPYEVLEDLTGNRATGDSPARPAP